MIEGTVGIVTLYGLNTLPTIYGSSKKGIKESDFDAVVSDQKTEFSFEIAALNEGVEMGEVVDAVGGWLKHGANIRTQYSIDSRPFLHDDSENATFSTIYTQLKSLSRYKYIFIKVSDYLYSVNASILGDVLLFPIAIESINIETQPTIKLVNIVVKHSQLNNL